MKTYVAKTENFPEDGRAWKIVDATGQTLGKLAVAVANVLRGKNKPIFTPHVDTGDYVVVINASGIALSGNKMKDKVYYHHTGWIGNLKSATAEEMMAKFPERVVEMAVSGMLPKNKLRAKFMKKLKVYAGEEHPHAAQKPEKMEIN